MRQQRCRSRGKNIKGKFFRSFQTGEPPRRQGRRASPGTRAEKYPDSRVIL